MPLTKSVIDRLKEAGYTAHEQKEHAYFVRKLVDGKPHIIRVQRKKSLDEDTVRILLRQAGLTVDEIEKFLGHCRS